MILGAHVSPQDPLAEAEARGIEAVQVFLSNPQQWKPPPPRDDAAALLASEIDSGASSVEAVEPPADAEAGEEAP